jgi:hypothetical protein
MKKINLAYDDEKILAEAEINNMETILKNEAIFEAEEDQENYAEVFIISFTFEDGLLPKRDGTLGSPEQFEAKFGENEKVFTTKNINGYNVFIATVRDDLHPMGYIIMNTSEFIEENPDGLFDIWVELLNEISV